MSDEVRRTSLQQVQREIPLSEDPFVETADHVAESGTADSSECNITSRQRVPSKLLDCEEVRIERAIDLNTKRVGHLGHMRKRLKFFQGLLSKHTSEQGVIQGVVDYEGAFHKFVDAYETYLRFEDDEEMRNVANESYEKEKECKFLFDLM